jgi:K+-transporting ATPase ATPase C chain
MRRQLLPAVKALLVFTALVGLAYPLGMTGLAQLAFDAKADGSLVRDARGGVVGSSLIGQPFNEARYFQPRPSAAGEGYDPTSTGASNLGPTNPELLRLVTERANVYRRANGLAADVLVPVDAVTASASGLDPHISVANAELQAARVARERGLPLETVRRLIAEHTDERSLGFLGEPGVNVLELNLALDRPGP